MNHGTSSTDSKDRHFMRRALRLAARGAGRTSPNPMVGAVVVQGEVVAGEGFHEYVGGPHAEVVALREAADRAGGATLYVTLEPCNHHGRTPPCTQAVLDSGVSKVVIGMPDPNPGVKGGGAEFLRQQGLAVQTGLLEPECRMLNQAFIKYVSTGLPHVTLKAAATLDGFIASSTGDSKWISNDRSRKFAHHLRSALDAVLIGIGTALADDPLLTARSGAKPACRQPVRILLDTHLRCPPDSRLVRTADKVPLWIACAEAASSEKERHLKEAGADVLRMPSQERKIHLPSLLAELAARQLTSLLVEGGASVLGEFIDNHLADDFCFFYAPKILGDPNGVPMVRGRTKGLISEAVEVYDVRVRRFGGDVLLLGRFNRNPW